MLICGLTYTPTEVAVGLLETAVVAAVWARRPGGTAEAQPSTGGRDDLTPLRPPFPTFFLPPLPAADACGGVPGTDFKAAHVCLQRP